MKVTVKMMCAAMLCGLMFVACGGGGKDYTGTYETTVAGMRIGMTLNADGTATAITGDEVKTGYFWEASEVNGRVFIKYGTKNDEGEFTRSGTQELLYEDGKLKISNVTYTKKQ